MDPQILNKFRKSPQPPHFLFIPFSSFSTLLPLLLLFLVSPPFLNQFFLCDCKEEVDGHDGPNLLTYFLNDGALFSAGKLKSHQNMTNCLSSPPSKVAPHDDHHEKISKSNLAPPICTLQTSQGSTENLTMDCIDSNVLRIIGDYNVLYINCSASYPLDFHFDGIKPTEGIYATFRNTLANNKDTTWPPKVVTHHVEIQVFSINTLFQMISRKGRHSWILAGRKNMTVPPSIQKGLQDYSRSGKFIFSGYLENSTIQTTVYLFLEEELVHLYPPNGSIAEKLARPTFIRNEDTKMTVSVTKNKVQDGKGRLYNILVPCRPSHYVRGLGGPNFTGNIQISMFGVYSKSDPSIRGSWACALKMGNFSNISKIDCNGSSTSSFDAKVEFDEMTGFTITHTNNDESTSGDSWGWKYPVQTGLAVKCLMEQDGVELDSLEFKISHDNSTLIVGLDELIRESPPPTGYDPSKTYPGVTIQHHVATGLDDQSSETGVLTRPTCHVERLAQNSRATLTNIDFVNSLMFRLVKHFVLPDFSNRSWSLQWGQQETELNQEFSILDGSQATAGATFCGEILNGQSSSSYGDPGRKSVKVYGVALVGKTYPFDFDVEYANLSRDETKGDVFLRLKLLTPNLRTGILYAGTDLSFRCTVNQFALVRPVVWYTQRENGSFVREYVDYTFPSYVIHSYFTTKMTTDVKRIFCGASLWNKILWKNISLPLDIQPSEKPYFLPRGRWDHVQKFPLNSENQVMRCMARGSPQPEVYWIRDGKNVSSSMINEERGSLILEFDKITESTAGQYICLAENFFGTDQKFFNVQVYSDGPDYPLMLGIPFSVFIVTAIGAWIYIRFFRKKETRGLTQGEIQEFLNGAYGGKGCQENGEAGVDGIYAHEFADLCPYNKVYEVTKDRFQIDRTTTLGSGAFGLVHKGLLDEEPVAVKTSKQDEDKMYLKALLSELKIMIHLGRHEHLVTILGACTKDLSKGLVYIFVEYCPLGSLEQFLKQHRDTFVEFPHNQASIRLPKNFPTNYIRLPDFGDIMNDKKVAMDHPLTPLDLMHFAIQINMGMDYLSSRKVIHGDLAARNVLLTENRMIKITDFGLSRKIYDYADYVKKQQEPLPWRWMAVESLRDMIFSSKSDVWAFGILLWEIFSLSQVPYPGFNWTMQFLVDLEGGMRMAKPRYASHVLYEQVMLECWQADPSKRPSFDMLRERLQSLLHMQKKPIYVLIK